MLLGFYLVGRSSHALATLWLAIASLFFYGWWDVRYVALLLASIAFNYFAGALIARARHPRAGGTQGFQAPRPCWPLPSPPTWACSRITSTRTSSSTTSTSSPGLTSRWPP
ncbi:hypothetical protein [Ramlibacter montanisoli]|uniref:hypothetical protein n=1 Tax=Ramlibacter montanisoli TaxID=2732512 RepID=UPI00209BDA3F|nr:hypothetical protein [Ramlibacter montanisoli]